MAVGRQAVADALAWAAARTGLFRAKPPVIPREMGHYWVRYGDDGQEEIAVWDDGQWWCAGDDCGYPPETMTVLSPRLTPPGVGVSVPRLAVRWNVPPGDAPDADTAGVLHGGAGA